MPETVVTGLFDRCRRTLVFLSVPIIAILSAGSAAAEERMYFSATDNITNVLVQKINAETVRIDMSMWHLTEHAITTALLNRFNAGVQVRLIGDRAEIFELNSISRGEFYQLASQGVPIRLRFNPTWYPEIDHWKATIFAGQNLVTFGSANYTPFELAPVSATNYKDETVLFTDDPAIVNAVKTKFDQIWNDTTREPESMIAGPPYLKDWNDACAAEPTGNCDDYWTLHPDAEPMIISTERLEPDHPLPPDIVWGQGPSFNNRLSQEIGDEPSLVRLVVFRLTVDNITTALLNKFNSGVPVQLLIEPQEYLNRKWPEFWLTHANLDKLWAAGVAIKQRSHAGLTHMKTLVTSAYATNASANYAAFWQRDINQFISSADKPALYQAVADRVEAMWNSSSAFVPFQPQPPDAATLAAPGSGATGVAATAPLVWNRAAFAVSYDVYLGTSPSNLTLAGNVPAQLTNNPPATYSWTSSTPLQSGTTYFWKIVSRTNATPVDPSVVAASATRSFTTAGTGGAPPAPANPTPANGAAGVVTNPTLSWSAGPAGTTYNVAFGSANPPPAAATGLSAPSYAPGNLAANTTYFWRVTAVSSGGSTAGPVWSFTTAGGGGGGAADVVIYAADVTNLNGSWTKVADSSAAAGIKLMNPDAGVDALAAPLANPPNYFEVQFQANAGTRYRLWMRMHPIGDSKWNDSVFVQYSDSVNSSGTPIHRIGTAAALLVNLWPCATCQSLGWGWQRNAYWLSDTGDVWFQSTGVHTIRVQIREDGSEIDQIVLSPTTYATNPPGPVSNDTTIVPKPSGGAPSAPASPSPANGATGVGTSATLSWTAAGATSYDVAFGTANPPPAVSTGQTTASYSPGTLSNSTTYFWRITARNSSGTTSGPIWSFATGAAAAANVVIYASDVPTGALHGSWTVASDPTSPNGIKLITPDAGWAATNAAIAAPAHYFDVTFNAVANTPYRLWMRIQALNNSKWNDSLWVQFSDATAGGGSIYPIGTSSALDVNLATDANATSLDRWGWQNTAYWLTQQTTFTFPTSGTHTMRIQVREDGVQLDQIVLSPTTYLNSRPGSLTNDSTIVPKP